MHSSLLHTLSFNEQFNNVCNSANFHLRALRHIRNYISEETDKTTDLWLISSMIHGRRNYCNALLCVISSANIHKLQRVHNSMAHAVTNSRRSEHNIKHVVLTHYVGCQSNIEYNTNSLSLYVYVWSAYNTRTELSVWIDPVSYPSRHLRASGCNCLQQYWVKLALTERAFCRAAPAVCNSLHNPWLITFRVSLLLDACSTIQYNYNSKFLMPCRALRLCTCHLEHVGHVTPGRWATIY